MKPLFKIIFENGDEYLGGDYINNKWLTVPQDKKIKSLLYLLPSGVYIRLNGYDKYCQFIECTKDLMGENRGKVNFEYAHVIGRNFTGTCPVYKINLKTGEKELKFVEANSDYINKINPDLWR